MDNSKQKKEQDFLEVSADRIRCLKHEFSVQYCILNLRQIPVDIKCKEGRNCTEISMSTQPNIHFYCLQTCNSYNSSRSKVIMHFSAILLSGRLIYITTKSTTN